MSSSGLNDREFENLVREGITAVRGRRLNVARRLLERAAGQNPTDARVWLWLSATTNEASEQREYLEKAVAADPYNTAAKRGLSILAKKQGQSVEGLPIQAHKDSYVSPNEDLLDPARTYEGTTQTFDCPQCGSRMHHQPDENFVACESCGHTVPTSEEIIADAAETPFGPVLQTGQAHVWAASAHEIVCEQCGAHSLEPPGVKTQACAYCGSNQLVESSQLNELIDPQAIGLFEINEEEALQHVTEWLQEGFFALDRLPEDAKNLELRAGYYPFWTFDGGVEISWSAEVLSNLSRSTLDNPEWRPIRGTDIEFFDDVLVPGVSAMKFRDVRRIFPFKLKELVRFEPAQLAGWNAMTYDRSISDASLIGRETVVRLARPKIQRKIEPGKEKRNISIGAGRWTGLTYKLIYLPMWVGSIEYGSEKIQILVNGQTGKVGGKKPKDLVKVIGVWLMGLLFFILVVIILYWWIVGLN